MLGKLNPARWFDDLGETAARGIQEGAEGLFTRTVSKRLVPKNVQLLREPGGRKLAQQIARFRAAGGVGGRVEYLEHVNLLAQRAREAGNFVTGRVGRGPQAIPNATIYREGRTFIVVDEAGIVRSYVTNASPGGVVNEFLRLGGTL